MEDLIEFRRPDGSTYFAKFPENESDKLVLPGADVTPGKAGMGKMGWLIFGAFFYWLFNEQILRNVGKRPR
jgi:hypothetical protein